MPRPKQKLFRDSVHGYITVPSDICSDFVDTLLLQRLRQIEQTSMRGLYPSAHHDRFVHSLGVYHLGTQAVANLWANAGDLLSSELGISDAEWRCYETSFSLACLLHDCGHSPFSHTLENLYARAGVLDDQVIECASCEDFARDYPNCSPAAHEKTSAILVLTEFADRVRRNDGDPVLVARMILGCEHLARTRSNFTLEPRKRLENCLISLLNGDAIDVDKLDYIVRDTWASGVDNVRVDMTRMMNAFTLVEIDGVFPRLAFESRALSVIQNVVEARNFLYRWIYSHHKVLYEVQLLKDAVEGVAKQLSPDGPIDEVLQSLFSVQSLTTPTIIGDYTFFYPSDADIIHLLKRYHRDIPPAREWLSRQHSKKALWKSHPEFRSIFEKKSPEALMRIQAACCGDEENALRVFCRSHGLPESSLVCLPAAMKTLAIDPNQLFVKIRDVPISYSDAIATQDGTESAYFIVYGCKERITKELREECIRSLKTLD